MRFSTIQLICLVTILGAIVALCFQNDTKTIIWRTDVLPYRVPNIPENYLQPIRGSADIIPQQEFTNGRELFEVAHYAGWKACRYHYFANYDLANSRYQKNRTLESIDLTTDSISTAATLAYVIGYEQFQDDVERLESKFTVNEIRRKMAIPKPNHRVPILAILLFSIIGFVLASSFKMKSL